jgi:hypothetical protein
MVVSYDFKSITSVIEKFNIFEWLVKSMLSAHISLIPKQIYTNNRKKQKLID